MLNIWDEHLWLPEGVSWEDMKSNATITYPRPADLKYTFLGGFVLLVLRIVLESFVFIPLGWMAGWIRQPLPSRIWEHLSGGFAGRSKFKRVAECCWRFTFYICAWIAGLIILWDSPQLRDVTECWRNWPHHDVSLAVWWYYMVEASFYWALFIGTIWLDVRRADFYQMLLHHAITILLLYISWSMNMVRVGTLILFIHDAADIVLDLMKVVRYAKWHNGVTALYLVFLAVWTATRLVYYPFWIIQSIWFDAPALIQGSYRWSNIFQRPLVPRVLMVMLTLLLMLHIFWTYVILKIAYVASTKSGNIDDVREDDDSESDEETRKKKE